MKCPFCAERIKDEAILCRFCGRTLKSQGVATPSPGESDDSNPLDTQAIDSGIDGIKTKFGSQKKKIAIAALSVFLVAGLGFGGYQFNEVQTAKKIEAERQAKVKAAAEAARKSREAEEAEIRRAIEDDSWVPAGFEKFSENPYMAYKGMSYSNCDNLCFPFELVTSKYCSRVYIQANIVRGSTILDWTNDTAYGVEPGQRVKMKMESYEDLPWSVNWVTVDCS